MKSIGIVGGAGPLAGALLFEKIIVLLQSKYGCVRDEDFPKISLLNYPFAEMLQEQDNSDVLRAQLQECFDRFVEQRIDLVAIACNTLHAFLPPIPPSLQLVDLIGNNSIWDQKTLVLCSSTTARYRLYKGAYPSTALQKEISHLIDLILAGKKLDEISRRMAGHLNGLPYSTFVLGCTEFSLLHERTPLHLHGLNSKYAIYDPITIAAQQLCELIF